MSLVKKIRKMPRVKKIIKNIYQWTGVLISDRKSSPDNIKSVSNSDKEALFGYYDKSPWSADDKYTLYLEVEGAKKYHSAKSAGRIILKNMETNKEEIIDTTNVWNSQQGSMLQWLGPDFKDNIIYNDFINNEYVSVILNIKTKEKKIINSPVYSLNDEGTRAYTLDFSRLETLRPGYGYSNTQDITKGVNAPTGCCVYE